MTVVKFEALFFFGGVVLVGIGGVPLNSHEQIFVGTYT